MDNNVSVNSAKRARQHSMDNCSVKTNIVISEALCYASRKFSNLPAKTLRQTLSNFYSADVLHAAKETLINVVEELKIDNWVKPAKRRRDSKENPGNKVRLDAEDITDILVFVDENNMCSKLPLFVAANPDLLPSLNINEGDMQCLLSKIVGITENIESLTRTVHDTPVPTLQELNTIIDNAIIKHNISDNISDCQKKIVDLNIKLESILALVHGISVSSIIPLHDVESAVHHVLDQRNIPDSFASLKNQMSELNNKLNSYGTKGNSSIPESFRYHSKPVNNNSRVTHSDSVLNSAVNLTDNVIDHSRQNTVASYETSYAFVAEKNQNNVRSTNTANTGNKKRLLMVGDSNTCSLRASKNPQVKKAVFRIDNIDEAFSAVDVTEYIATLKVRLINCFELPKTSRHLGRKKEIRVSEYVSLPWTKQIYL